MPPDEKLEKIQEEIKQLWQKQLEMVEGYQQQPFFYRWLAATNPKLEAINNQIARLEKDKENYFKVIQVILNRNI
jgi:hypothetical protein